MICKRCKNKNNIQLHKYCKKNLFPIIPNGNGHWIKDEKTLLETWNKAFKISETFDVCIYCVLQTKDYL